MRYFILILVTILSLNSCDFVECDLTIVNNSSHDLYFYTHPYQQEASYPFNFAIMERRNQSSNEIEYYYDFDNCKAAIHANDSIKDCLVNQSFEQFANEYGGLTILAYTKELVESVDHDYQFTEVDIYKRIDLTVHDLNNADFITVIE